MTIIPEPIPSVSILPEGIGAVLHDELLAEARTGVAAVLALDTMGPQGRRGGAGPGRRGRRR